jgi:hypothetical protein
LQKLDHEILVLYISPRVKAIFIGAWQIWNTKVPSEVLEETEKHEILINVALDLTW